MWPQKVHLHLCLLFGSAVRVLVLLILILVWILILAGGPSRHGSKAKWLIQRQINLTSIFCCTIPLLVEDWNAWISLNVQISISGVDYNCTLLTASTRCLQVVQYHALWCVSSKFKSHRKVSLLNLWLRTLCQYFHCTPNSLKATYCDSSAHNT